MSIREILKIAVITMVICLVIAQEIPPDSEPQENTEYVEPQENTEYVELQENTDYVEPPPEYVVDSDNGDSDGHTSYENTDILFVSWVPYPVDKWDFTLVNLSDPRDKEQGREDLATFTKETYPDVSFVFACTPKDRDYFINYNFNVPVIGVDPFQHDKAFLAYLDSIYNIHGFRNPTELWAHFIEFQDAFLPVIGRFSEEFQTYLEEWKPLDENTYDPEVIEYRHEKRSLRARSRRSILAPRSSQMNH